MATGRRARWVYRILLMVLIAAIGGVGAVGTARAGGPTSALLVSPGTDRAAALYYSDPEYEQLNSLLGGYAPASSPTGWPASQAGGDYVTVTWMIHDVSIWRIDRIFLDAVDGPLIVTQMVDATGAAAGMYPGETGSDAAVTHRSPDPAALQNLLSSLGLVGPGSGRSDAAGPIDARSGSAWWWALAGVVAGALLTAAAVRFLPAVRGRLSEPAVAAQPAIADEGTVRMTPLSS